MIESRWSGREDSDFAQGAGQVARLRNVSFSWIRNIPALFLDDPRLDKLRAEGLQVECEVLPW